MPACENTLFIGSAPALMESYPALFTDVTGWTEPIIGNGSSQHYDLFIKEVKNDTFIARRCTVPLSCRAPACPTLSCHIDGAPL
ncbi:Hypothetical predicted protein [Scomber scombrus]|uniref:Uncharacterized protein n=1 Tax=Scomber scombrus TaxID=13677 RepID=A0AAV1NTB9_SCOSC